MSTETVIEGWGGTVAEGMGIAREGYGGLPGDGGSGG